MKEIDISSSRRVEGAMRLAREIPRQDDILRLVDTALAALRSIHGVKAHLHISRRGLEGEQFRIRRFHSEHDEELVERSDIYNADVEAEIFEGGIIPKITDSAEPRLFHDVYIEDDEVLGDALASFHSIVSAPLFMADGHNDWIVVLSSEPDGATIETAAEMILYSNMLGIAIGRDGVAQRLLEAHATIQREVDEIARIQHSLLPEKMPKVAGLSLAASYETFDRAGGDYYDILPLERNGGEPNPEGLWVFIMADASGHGPAAAVVMAMVHALFNSYAESAHGPAEFLEHINANLQSHRVGYSFVTAFLATYDPKSRELRYANAGHPAPIVMTPGPDGAAMHRLTEVGNIPLGIEREITYEEGAVTLERGQSLVFYTDGIIESVNRAGDLFRVEGIEEALRMCNGKPDCVTLEVIDALKEHEAGLRARDDQTILAMHLEP